MARSRKRRKGPTASTQDHPEPSSRPFNAADPDADEPKEKATIFGVPVVRAIEIVLGAIAIPLLAYLGLRVTSIDTTVSNANLPVLVTNVTTTKDRVDRLFEAFPEMRLRIAEERATTPVHLALVVTEPKTASDPALLHVADFDAGSLQTFELPPGVRARADYELLVRGMATSIDPNATRLSTVEAYLKDANKPTDFPTYVDQDLSYAITTRPNPDRLRVYTSAFAKSSGIAPYARTVPLDRMTFSAFSESISNNQALWRSAR